MDKLTPQEAALYLGQKATAIWPTGSEGTIKITPLCLLDIERDYFASVKLLLRPLSDITEEEAIELDISRHSREYLKAYPHDFIGNAERIAKALRMGFDLFGFIEQGKALDKTKAPRQGWLAGNSEW